jgi:hypothetical protein
MKPCGLPDPEQNSNFTFIMATNTSTLATLQVLQMEESAVYQLSGQLYGLASYLHCGWSSWQLFLAFLFVLVTYDQGTMALQKLYKVCRTANVTSSHVHQDERLDCRTSIQDTIHGPFLASTTSKI